MSEGDYDPYEYLCPVCKGMPEIATSSEYGEISKMVRVICTDCFVRTWGTSESYPTTKDYYFTVRNEKDLNGWFAALKAAVEEWKTTIGRKAT